MLRKPAGFTLIELLVAMVLMGLVTMTVYQLIVNSSRIYRYQSESIDLNQNIRTAIAVLPSEIRELDAADAAGSDIVAMTASSFRYNAMRNVHFLCQPPNIAASQITVGQDPSFGIRGLDASRDLLMIFAENNPQSRADDVWLRAEVNLILPGVLCPGGDPSWTLNLVGVTAAQLGGVTDGAPVRGYEVVEFSLYTDVGDTWLGTRVRAKGSGSWSTLQPIAGPLTATGLQLTYLDTLGVATAVPAEVARIGITVSGMTREVVRTSSGSLGHATGELITQVALRNNPRF